MEENNKLDLLCQKYSPIIYFHGKEAAFPIKIEKYLSACRLVEQDGKTLTENPTSEDIYSCKQEGKTVHLEFKTQDWEELLAGSPDESSSYCISVKNQDVIRIIYFYLFSHTEPYKFCFCGPPLVQYAHKADLKFICLEFKSEDSPPSRVYYGAHGTKAGVWKDYSEVEKEAEHPIAYSALGDHSFYPESGQHPRIYFVAWDQCEKGKSSSPSTILVKKEGKAGFDPKLHGWCYLPGNMNVDGIVGPWKQNFWNADLPTESNSVIKRLLCPEFF